MVARTRLKVTLLYIACLVLYRTANIEIHITIIMPVVYMGVELGSNIKRKTLRAEGRLPSLLQGAGVNEDGIINRPRAGGLGFRTPVGARILSTLQRSQTHVAPVHWVPGFFARGTVAGA